jgi:hypothetical protein
LKVQCIVVIDDLSSHFCSFKMSCDSSRVFRVQFLLSSSGASTHALQPQQRLRLSI